MKRVYKVAAAFFIFAVLFFGCMNADVPSEYDFEASEYVKSSENKDFKYDIYTEYAEITEYIGKKTRVFVPDFLGGKPVASIGKEAFKSNGRVSEVILPETVCRIQDRAFYECAALEKIQIPDSVSHVGRDILDMTRWLSDRDDEEFVIIGNNVLIRYNGEYEDAVVPYGVLQIAHGAFKNSDELMSLTISDGIKVLDGGILDGCSGLKDIYLPESVEKIEKDAFGSCKALRCIVLPAKDIEAEAGFLQGIMLEEFIMPDGITVLGEGLFYNASIERLTIPNTVRKISKNCFEGADIEEVIIPEGVQEIGEYAFYNSNVKRVAVPESVSKLNDGTFFRCMNIESIDLPEGLGYIGSDCFAYCSMLKALKIPDTVYSIGAGAFRYCTLMENIILPKELMSLERELFLGCESIRAVYIPESVRSIGEEAFKDCTGLKSITLPDAIESIGFMAFYKCESLRSIRLPQNLLFLWGNAFYECTMLESVEFNESLQLIGDLAFAYSGISGSIELPDSVSEIGQQAFIATKLEAVSIPQYVQKIGTDAFKYCAGLTLYVTEDSYGYQYALNNSLSFKLNRTESSEHINEQETLPNIQDILNLMQHN